MIGACSGFGPMRQSGKRRGHKTDHLLPLPLLLAGQRVGKSAGRPAGWPFGWQLVSSAHALIMLALCQLSILATCIQAARANLQAPQPLQLVAFSDWRKLAARASRHLLAGKVLLHLAALCKARWPKGATSFRVVNLLRQ